MLAESLREQIVRSIEEGVELRLRLAATCADHVVQGAELIRSSLAQGGKVLLFGNGGSAADAQHIAAEFVGRFARERVPLPAIALTTDTSILTAIGNDYGFEEVFARQVRALCNPNDIAIAISTSGRSPNVIAGVKASRDCGARTIGMIGGDGGELVGLADVALVVPSTNTARVQECHITLGHLLCEAVESLWLRGPATNKA